MTQETVRALSDADLVNVIAWAQGEQKARAERRKRDTIAKIKELAQTVGVSVNIAGTRGRPANVSRRNNALEKRLQAEKT
jgi:hypothetical protein